MKPCPLCSLRVDHLKKHMKKIHPQDYKVRYKQSIIRSHTWSVVYLQNFSHLSSSYLEKRFTINMYRPPTRKETLIYVHDKIENGSIHKRSLKNIGVNKGIYSSKVGKVFRGN